MFHYVTIETKIKTILINETHKNNITKLKSYERYKPFVNVEMWNSKL